jgi:mannosyltransferase OCH1-like enzyme
MLQGRKQNLSPRQWQANALLGTISADQQRSDTMAIPKIIHQIWLSSAVPPKLQDLSASFSRLMPDWEHRLWNDALSLELVETKFPELLDSYLSLESPVAKVDLLRYMVLFEHGGMYADMDCECKRGLDFITDADELIVCKEIDTQSIRVMNLYPTDISPVYCQWAFLASPGHAALKTVLEHIARNLSKDYGDHPILQFVKRTGPHAFTAGLEQYMKAGGAFSTVPSSYFGCFDTRNTFQLMKTTAFPELGRKVYIRHHFEGSWIDEKFKKKMILRNLLLMPEPIVKTRPT